MTDLSYFVGVDHREYVATQVAAKSAAAYAKPKNLAIHELDHYDLRRRQFFDRPWRIDEMGQYWDERDGKPFSTQFAHSRFLTPLIAKQQGYTGWALFTDSDVLWLASPFEMLDEVDSRKTVMVVKHNYAPDVRVKMDNQRQDKYHRKLWSAVMLWNLSSNYLPTYEMVNNAAGGWLHAFGWLDDNQIGSLSEGWHWIADASPTTTEAIDAEERNKVEPINLVHFTNGIPHESMPNRTPTPFDNFWTNEYQDLYR